MFDIEPVSLVISMVIISLFALPFVIYKRKQSQKIKSQNSFIEGLENSSKLKFDESDKWRDIYFIGIDTAKKILVYIKFGPENTVFQIDLTKATDVQLIKIERPTTIDGKPTNVIDGLILKIETKDEKRDIKMLEFYDCEIFSDNMGELPLIQKWEKILKPVIKANPSQVRVSALG
jgi:hypothetical protein